MVHPTVTIQISEISVPSTPSWFGEVAAFAHILGHLGQLEAIEQRVRFARARFGHYDTLDFIVVLIGYALSGEATLKAFYERLLPFAPAFMALFGRHDLPARSTLSRFLAALNQPAVEALRALFREDLVARSIRLSTRWRLGSSGKALAGTSRALFDFPDLPVTPTGPRSRVIVATHQAPATANPIGVTRDEVVYELFFTALPPGAFTPADVVDLYLHRGSFETVLPDEDVEQDSDRWCSRTPNGQEFWQILNQWVWNLRLELGQKLSSSEIRTTEFAPVAVVEPPPAIESASAVVPARSEKPTPQVRYGPPQWARPSFTRGFPGSAFTLQPDGTLRCPADRPLYPQERRPERDGSVRVLYAARISHCRSSLLRARCQESSTTIKPRRMSAVLWSLSEVLSACSPPPPDPPEPPPSSPVLWRDLPRCQLRRQWLKLIRSETVTFSWEPPQTAELTAQTREEVVTRAKRAHYRLSWQERLARNASPAESLRLSVTLHGVPPAFVASFGFALQTAA